MEQQTFEGFLKTVVRSGLIAAPDFQTIREAAPVEACADAKSLANYLVRIGKLSRFQAAKLLEGVTLGLVLGPFHVLAPIGKGGMGAVYLARDIRNQTLIAVKVLPPKRAKAQERLLVRFRREMELSQRVIHPHLTRTIEVGVHLGINYIGMEYIPGKNLHKLIHEEGPLKVPRAARMFAEVAEGLEYAHRQSLIHRDLKPSNIMVMPDDHVKVLDLGLALIQGECEAERSVVGGQGYVVGTLDFIAPEQAEDPLSVDSRSDIYSLGCTLYYALTGSAPFSGGNALQKMLRHRCDPPRPVCEINPSVPATFAVLLTRMIAKKPEMRFRSAAELRDALLPWMGETPGLNPRKDVPVAKGPMATPAVRANGPEMSAAPPAAASPPPASPAPAWAMPFPSPVAGPPFEGAAPGGPALQAIPARKAAALSTPATSAPTVGPVIMNDASKPPLAVPMGAVPPGLVVPAAIVVSAPAATASAAARGPIPAPPPISPPSPPSPAPAWAAPAIPSAGAARPVAPLTPIPAAERSNVKSASPPLAVPAAERSNVKSANPPLAAPGSERSNAKSASPPLAAPGSERPNVKSMSPPLAAPASERSNVKSVPLPLPAIPSATPPTAAVSQPRSPSGAREAAKPQVRPQPADAKVPAAVPPAEILKPAAELMAPKNGPAPLAIDPAEELPFWLDYFLPVGSAGLFLLVVWILALMALWQ